MLCTHVYALHYYKPFYESVGRVVVMGFLLAGHKFTFAINPFVVVVFVPHYHARNEIIC